MKVICIDDDFSKSTHRRGFEKIKYFPKFLETYTVSDVKKYRSGHIGFELEELDNPPNLHFASNRFAEVEEIEVEKLQEIKQRIEQRELLTIKNR